MGMLAECHLRSEDLLTGFTLISLQRKWQMLLKQEKIMKCFLIHLIIYCSIYICKSLERTDHLSTAQLV